MIVLLYAFAAIAFLWACVLIGSPFFGSADGGTDRTRGSEGHGSEESTAEGRSATAKQARRN
jgi:hypothetical protein